MANQRLCPFWGHLTEALRTGQPQNDVPATGAFIVYERTPHPAVVEALQPGGGGPLMRFVHPELVDTGRRDIHS
jgi:hypothetical protein